MRRKNLSLWTRPLLGLHQLWAGAILWGVVSWLGFTELSYWAVANPLLPQDVLSQSLLSAGLSLAVLALVWLVYRVVRRHSIRQWSFGLACGATVLALGYVEENLRGHWAWSHYRHQKEAKGEQFELGNLAPPAVPDSENFAMQPLWVEQICSTLGAERAQSWYGPLVAALGHTNYVATLAMPLELENRREVPLTHPPGDWRTGAKINLELWRDYFRALGAFTNFYPIPTTPESPAHAVLLALSRFNGGIEKLRAASQLAYARFPVCYAEQGHALLPHLATLKGCVMTLQLRAVAEGQSNHPEEALEDIQLMLRLTQSVRGEPFLITQLVRMSMLWRTLQPIWEGLSLHQWSDSQLVTLGAALEKLDFLTDYALAMRGERALSLETLDYLRLNPDRAKDYVDLFNSLDDPGERKLLDSNLKYFLPWLFCLAPNGWFDQSKVFLCRERFDLLLPIVNLDQRLFSPSQESRARRAAEQFVAQSHPYLGLTFLLRGSLEMVARKFVQAQAAIDLARTAIALERYRLDHGSFPETLAALHPQWGDKIPHDLLTGQPLKYRRLASDRFRLYGIGWNQQDQGGTLTLNSAGDADWKNGDWVWVTP